MKKATGILMAVVIAGLIAWDIIVVVEPTPGDTISEITYDLSEMTRTLPFALGALMGHLLVPRSITWGLGTRLGAAGVLLALAGIAHFVPIPVWTTFAVGFPLGFLLWPQTKKE